MGDNCRTIKGYTYMFSRETNNESLVEDANSKTISDDLSHLQHMLADKLQENERLKQLNNNLSLNSRQKDKEIKELTNALIVKNPHAQNQMIISNYKDKLGQCNVEIQKLKKQINTEMKKLNNERAKNVRLEKSRNRSSLEPKSTHKEMKEEKFSSGKDVRNFSVNEKKRDKMKSPSYELNEECLQDTLDVVDDEPSIFDETLEEPYIESDEEISVI